MNREMKLAIEMKHEWRKVCDKVFRGWIRGDAISMIKRQLIYA